MNTYRSHLIAREGWMVIVFVALIAIVLRVVTNDFVALPFWVAMAALIVIFRDPKRVVPPKPLAIVSPVDGQITAIHSTKDPYTHAEATQIELRKGVFDVISTRSPMEGKVIQQWFKPVDGEAIEAVRGGIYSNADVAVAGHSPSSKSTEEHKGCFAQWIQSDEQDDVVMVVESAANVLKPHCYAQSGERVGQGQRCGFVLFNASVQVYIPASSRVEVKVGDHVRGGSDTLATLVH
jgi:phosphatidylserine decarboxylase